MPCSSAGAAQPPGSAVFLGTFALLLLSHFSHPSPHLLLKSHSCSRLRNHHQLLAGRGSLLEKAMAPHSSTLAWKIPWTEAWQAAVHRIAESWTQLSDFTFTFHFHALEKEMATHSSVLAWRIPGTGQPGGLLSLGSHRSDTTEAT